MQVNTESGQLDDSDKICFLPPILHLLSFYFISDTSIKITSGSYFIWQILGTQREIERAVCKTVKSTEQSKCKSYSPSLYAVDGYNKIFFIHPSEKLELFTHIYAECPM